MKRKYLGDSFDIVKRFWYERLADFMPVVAHPKLVPPEIRTDFERMIRNSCPNDTDTSKWGSPAENRKWISFEDLQEWHPDFAKDRY